MERPYFTRKPQEMHRLRRPSDKSPKKSAELRMQNFKSLAQLSMVCFVVSNNMAENILTLIISKHMVSRFAILSKMTSDIRHIFERT